MTESKIILSLSSMREGAKPCRFRCPENLSIQGTQTNEAPVKYLLKKDPAIKRIICLVTPTARKNALQHFRREITGAAPWVQIELIDVPDRGQLPQEAMAEVIRKLNPGDSVYMDSSGGTRYTIMGLMQLTRILEYKGVRLRQVVYANLSAGQQPVLDDVTHLYRGLDLISGMHELADFGSVDTLNRFFRRQATPDAAVIVRLLDAIAQMTEAITLCRLGTLKSAVAGYREALEQAKVIKDPLMRELLEIFREKFGDEITTPWLVNWCLDHRMLIQALSIYREWMPEYILRHSGLFTAVPELPESWRANPYQDDHVFLWTWLLNLAKPEGGGWLHIHHTLDTIQNLHRYIRGSGFAVTDVAAVRRLAWDSLYIQTIRNTVLHSNESVSVDKKLKRALEEEGYDMEFGTMSVSDMTNQIRRAVKRAQQIIK